MIAEWLHQRSLLIQELKEQNELLRQENAKLYERIIEMASSVPHLKVVKYEDLEIEANSPLAVYGEGNEEGVRIGNQGANVA